MTNIGNVMLIGSNNNLAIWNDYVLQYIDMGVGTISKNGFIKHLGSLFFLHYSGIFRTVGGLPQIISEKVERYIYGATKAGLEACTCGKKETSVFFCIGDVTLKHPDGSIEKVIHDICLEYNIVHQNWYLHTGIKANLMTTFLDTLNPDRLCISTSDTNYPIYEFLTSQIYTDDGKAILFRADTSAIPLGITFEKVAYPLELCIEMERGSGLKVFVSLDWGEWYELDTEAGKGSTIIKVNRRDMDSSAPPRCRNIRISLRHAGIGACRVTKMAINYIISAEEEVIKPDEYATSPYAQ